MYSAARLSMRLVNHDESVTLCDDGLPSFLRRRKAQGKAEFRRRGDGE
jgi:hypothetical protein